LAKVLKENKDLIADDKDKKKIKIYQWTPDCDPNDCWPPDEDYPDANLPFKPIKPARPKDKG